MNKPITVTAQIPSVTYYAMSNGSVVYSGSSVKVAPYIAKKRAEGYDVDCGADGATTQVRQQRVLALENRVEAYTVGFRILKKDGPPASYLTGMYKTESDAAKFRAEALNDLTGQSYSIQPVNWRGARL